ncbi:sulfatase-like hydrolase/transferase [Pseudocolwellia agarivorans]|uniref:sulfatase-like hydrolase/transferase n=1 Tax=Pseudocolwellia agarivorans TaxID=1911682 RepID=UPI00098448A3|nr:sulfatase-like hydrolase/transferase [Pseudocolwellia agarivorans]
MTIKLGLGVTLCILLSACVHNKDEQVNNIVDSDKSKPQIALQHLTDHKADYTNVVLILIDDLSHYGVTAYGANRLHSYDGLFTNREFSTPNIDSLAKAGLRVDHAFAYPICENTRIALMSGKNNDRNYLQPKSQHRSDITFGDAFKKAGYVTGLYGKWKQTRGDKQVAGKDYISEFGWDDYTAFDVVTEGQRFINPNLVVNGKVTNYQGRTDLDPETGRRWYGPDIVNRDALKFIDKNKDKPFFLYYPMMLVHDDHKPTPDTQPHAIFDNFSEKAEYNNKGGDDRRYFPDMIEYMDKLIGQVVAKLDEAGVRDNTLIVVMGDNGTKETFGHVLPDNSIYPGRKGGNADNGLHVPLVINYPNVVPASKDGSYRSYKGLVNLTDIYPTIAQAAGIEIANPEQLDGISFWEQAKGAAGEPRKTIHTWYIGNSKYQNKDVVLRYAFNKHFKRYAPDKDFPEGRFFDLRTDLLEREGARFIERKWKVKRYSGLNLTNLTPEQQQAYNELGKVLDENKLISVKTLAINSHKTTLNINETLILQGVVLPEQAKRKGLIWESSNPEVLSVNKFGEITAHKQGVAEISIYSWDDADPLAANTAQPYSKTGISASKVFKVN